MTWHKLSQKGVAFLKLLGASVMTAVITIALASALSGQSAKLAQRVDSNSRIAAQEAQRTRELICAIAAQNSAINPEDVQRICDIAASEDPLGP